MINKLRMIMFLGLLTSVVVFISGCVQEKAVWNETIKKLNQLQHHTREGTLQL